MMTGMDGGVRAEGESRVMHGRRVSGSLTKGNIFGVGCVRRMHDGELLPNPIYRCETLVFIGADWWKIDNPRGIVRIWRIKKYVSKICDGKKPVERRIDESL